MRKPRKGIVLIVVLVCLAVAMALVVSWLRTAALERRALGERQNRAQAEWLAESALSRAVARLGADANYRGEVWKLSADELGFGQDSAEIEIVVEPPSDGGKRRTIRARADYPAEERRRHRSTKQIEFINHSKGDAS